MQEQLEYDINRILKEKYGIKHKVKVSNVTRVGAHRTCSIEVGYQWVFDGICYESLNERAVFHYHPETVADMMVDKIKRFKKYGNK